jgi:hypothetical protein
VLLEQPHLGGPFVVSSWQNAALPERRIASRRTWRGLGGFAEVAKEAGDVVGLLIGLLAVACSADNFSTATSDSASGGTLSSGGIAHDASSLGRRGSAGTGGSGGQKSSLDAGGA